MNLEIIDVDPAIRGALGLLANGLGHPVDQLEVEGVLLRHFVLRGQLQAVLVVLRKLNRNDISWRIIIIIIIMKGFQKMLQLHMYLRM